MKQCPKCKQTYSDDQLNFCLEDGELLTAFAQEPPPERYKDESPPTLMMNDPRATNPTNWPQTPPSQPPAQWRPQQQNIQNQPFRSPAFVSGRDQTMPTISLILGILGIFLVCCYGGIWLGLPAAILGFLGMRNADSDPSRYGGRGMAIGGMVLGVVSLLGSIVFIMLAIAGNIVN